MARKYENLFVTKDKPGYQYPDYLHFDPKTSRRLAYIDETTVAGAEFGCENIWLLPGAPEERKVMDANTQPYDRYFGFYAHNYENIRDLCVRTQHVCKLELQDLAGDIACFGHILLLPLCVLAATGRHPMRGQ